MVEKVEGPTCDIHASKKSLPVPRSITNFLDLNTGNTAATTRIDILASSDIRGSTTSHGNDRQVSLVTA